MNTNRRTAEIDMKIVKISMVSVPGPILVAFGLLGKFGEPDEIPFEFLNNSTIVNSMIVVGLAIMICGSFAVFKLFLEKGNV